MPLKYIAPTRKRNVLSPTLRQGKGWSTGQLVERYSTGVRNAVLLTIGELVYAPFAGSHVAWARTQPMSDKIKIGLEESIRRSVALLVPDVTVLGIVIDHDQSKEKRTINVRWGIPEELSRPSDLGQMAVGPINTTVRY